MDNSTENTDASSVFRNKYSDYSDDRIKEILKNHKDYQPPAVSAAVQIAIERELIHSEQDLMAPEFQSAIPHGVSVFPVITNSYYYKRIVSSIFRVLFILGIIPIVFGIMKYADGKINLSVFALILGSVWLLLTYLLLRTRRILILLLQMNMFFLTIIAIGNSLINQEVFHRTDFVMLVIGSVVSLYLMGYLKKLIETKPEEI